MVLWINGWKFEGTSMIVTLIQQDPRSLLECRTHLQALGPLVKEGFWTFGGKLFEH